MSQPLSIRDYWKLVEKHIDETTVPDPLIRHNFKVMYYTGFKDMLTFALYTASTMREAEARVHVDNIRREVTEFFSPEHIAQMHGEVTVAHAEYLTSLIHRAMDELGEPPAPPDAPPNETLH